MKTLVLNLIFISFLMGYQSVTAQEATLVSEVKIDKEETDKDKLIQKYSWLKAHLKKNKNQTISISEMVYANIPYLTIKVADQLVMYDAEGNRYCTQSDKLNCKEFYNLTEGELSWSGKA